MSSYERYISPDNYDGNDVDYGDILNYDGGGYHGYENYAKYGVKNFEEFEKKFPGYLPYFGEAFGDDDDEIDMLKNKITELFGLIRKKPFKDSVYDVAKLEIELDNIKKELDKIKEEEKRLEIEYNKITDDTAENKIKKVGIDKMKKDNQEKKKQNQDSYDQKNIEINNKKISIIEFEIEEFKKELDEKEKKEKKLSTLCKIMFIYENIIGLYDKLEKLYKEHDKIVKTINDNSSMKFKLEEYKKIIDDMENYKYDSAIIEVLNKCRDDIEKVGEVLFK